VLQVDLNVSDCIDFDSRVRISNFSNFVDSFSHLMNLLKQHDLLIDFLFVNLLLYKFFFNNFVNQDLGRPRDSFNFNSFPSNRHLIKYLNWLLDLHLDNGLSWWFTDCLGSFFIAFKLMLSALKLNHFNDIPQSIL
jgi:hypothetical protein